MTQHDATTAAPLSWVDATFLELFAAVPGLLDDVATGEEVLRALREADALVTALEVADA
ncbi:hypothetical protein [Nitriliruptor alkaliphilus]|uniref:hypothetical protein n=1 Tax=Nitriliruptor alkaliphilus TaxID=427918 RepID=UPI0012ED2FF7|nr:hypothetical protein [Nitriliruptor alkaliphilus]